MVSWFSISVKASTQAVGSISKTLHRIHLDITEKVNKLCVVLRKVKFALESLTVIKKVESFYHFNYGSETDIQDLHISDSCECDFHYGWYPG